MSKLKELIGELCPDGVEYRSLGELGKFYGGLSGKSRDDFVDGNEKYITYKNVYFNPSLKIDINDKVKIKPGEKQHILQYGDVIFTGSSETPDECGISSVVATKTDEKLYLNSFCFFFRFNDLSIMHPDFAKHLFRSNELRHQIGKTASGVTRYNVSKRLMEKVVIPIPPLEVQHEIVCILDNFTELTEELTEELTARRQQYEYYLNVILNNQRNKWEKTTLKEVANVRDGTHDSPRQSDSGFKLATSKNISSGRLDLSTCYFISEKDYNEINLRSQVNQYDILFSMIGTVGDVVIVMDKPCFAIKNMGLIKTNGDLLLSKYIYYWLQSDFSKAYIQSNLKGTAPKYLSLALLRDFPIYIPTNANEMKEIVNSIDSLNNLSTDLGHGLPAEIEARQKQYEYYRDKLLTFKGKVA